MRRHAIASATPGTTAAAATSCCRHATPRSSTWPAACAARGMVRAACWRGRVRLGGAREQASTTCLHNYTDQSAHHALASALAVRSHSEWACECVRQERLQNCPWNRRQCDAATYCIYSPPPQVPARTRQICLQHCPGSQRPLPAPAVRPHSTHIHLTASSVPAGRQPTAPARSRQTAAPWCEGVRATSPRLNQTSVWFSRYKAAATTGMGHEEEGGPSPPLPDDPVPPLPAEPAPPLPSEAQPPLPDVHIASNGHVPAPMDADGPAPPHAAAAGGAGAGPGSSKAAAADAGGWTGSDAGPSSAKVNDGAASAAEAAAEASRSAAEEEALLKVRVC
jgi:hypothetical protein